MAQNQIACKFCGDMFKEERYLQRHLQESQKCKRFRGLLFVCLRCKNFNTTSIFEWDKHIKTCSLEHTANDVFQKYRDEIKDLRAKLSVAKTMIRSPDNEEINDIPDENEVLDQTFGEDISEDTDVFELFSGKYNSLNAKHFSKNLREIKLLRMKIFRRGNIPEYIKLLKFCSEKLEDFFKSKNYTQRKIQKQIVQHFNPLDLRFLKSTNYEKHQPDGSTLKELDIALSFAKHPNIFHSEWIRSKIIPETIGLFPLKSTLSRILCHKNPTYVYFGDPGNEDPFAFYQLCKIDEQDKHHWRMDCRAQNLVLELQDLCSQSLVSCFRDHYYNIFNDNEYRENFLSFSLGLHDEFLMIFKNIRMIRNLGNFSRFCQFMITEKNVMNPCKRDILNLTKIDPVQTPLEDNEEKSIYFSLFDGINSEEVENLVII